jgi:hypothetical protein
MKVTIEFDGHEEREDLQAALDGSKWKIAMWNLDQQLRSVIRNEHFKGRQATSLEIEASEMLREELRRILDYHNLNLEE